MSRAWTTTEQARAVAMFKAKDDAAMIAAALDRTEQAVDQAVDRRR